ncbi:uncharacterized protein [Setaria viridis]|uniref:uncharacterized protein n=1 Tax=Setaria viridis TaxID=4556 RepID=UPI003B3B857D
MLLQASARGDIQHPLLLGAPCSFLQYADDTLIIIKADSAHLATLKGLLQELSTMIGLHINYEKSTVIPIAIDINQAYSLAATFGCPLASFPQTYLRLPLSTNKLRLCDLQPLVRAVAGYIPGWCGPLLTPSGCTTLANAVLGAKPVYAMCSVLLLQCTIEVDDAIRRAFIWTDESQCNGGQCKSAWKMVCWDKLHGDLGVKDLAIRNRGLLSKFQAKLQLPPTTNWLRWFWKFYGPAAGHDLGDSYHLDTPIWTTLLKLLPEFRQCTQVHLGDGANYCFWFDHWLGP